MSIAPVPGLRGLTAYHVPRHPAPIDLALHANEGPPVPAALFDSVRDPELARRYPSAARLEAVLAQRLGIEPGRLRVTAGADEALDRAFRAFVAPDDTVVLPSPTFVMLPHYARLAGAVVYAPPWPAEVFPEAAVLDALESGDPKPRAVALVSPNNPTGAVIPTDTLLRIARAAPDVLMLVDFAYVEVAERDPTAEVLALPNTLVFRTLSKVWGLAGLRVGYVAGPAPLIAVLRAAGGPYSVASTSVQLALAHLASGEHAMRAYVDEVRRERGPLYERLAEHGLRPVRSEANFVFARLPSEAAAFWLRDGLAALGIGIRIFPGEPGISDGARITCPGDAAQLTRLLDGIAAVMDPSRWSLVSGVEGVEAIRATRARGEVPIALGDPSAPAAHDLLAAGAARVVRSADEREAIAVLIGKGSER